jgi:hypothetical protein
MATTFNDQVLLFGGDSDNPSDQTLTYLWQWSGSTWTANEAFGPTVTTGWVFGTVAGAAWLVGAGAQWKWDGSDWSVSTVSDVNPYGGACSATVGTNLVVYGGEDADFNTIDQTWTFDGTNWTQMSAKGPSARAFAGMAALDGTVVLFGGASMIGFDAPGTLADAATWTFDGKTWTEHDVPGPSARMNMLMVTE